MHPDEHASTAAHAEPSPPDGPRVDEPRAEVPPTGEPVAAAAGCSVVDAGVTLPASELPPSELPPSELPADLRPLERRVVPYWLVSGTVWCLVLYGLLAALVTFLVQRLPRHESWLWTVAIVVAALLGVWTIVAPPLAFRRWRYGLTSELLLVRHGILWHEERTIPISRMQHVDLSRGPVERWFGLATLVVFTAGSDAAAVRIPGLAVPVAAALRDRILEARGVDVV